MKMNGRKIEKPNQEIIALPRSDGNDLIFIAQAVLSYEVFDKMCPPPKPAMKLKKGGEKEFDFNNPVYKEQLNQYSRKRYAWMILESLKATPNLEWETVDFGKPETWANYEKELQSAGVSDVEAQRIVQGVSDANCLNEGKIQEARKRFLAGTLEVGEKSSSHQPELLSTQSGELVKVGEYVPQV